VAQDTRQIEETIRSERSDLDRNLRELEMQAKALTDWRTHYRNHAGATMAAAFGGGLLIGLMTTRRQPRPVRASAYEGSTSERHEPRPRGERFRFLKALGDNPRARQQAGDAWSEIVETLVGLASAKAIDLISGVIPGFREEYHTRHAIAPRDRAAQWPRG
jgi:hypothetical protein